MEEKYKKLIKKYDDYYYVPDKYKTKEMNIFACNQDPFNIWAIDKEKRNLKLAKIIIEKDICLINNYFDSKKFNKKIFELLFNKDFFIFKKKISKYDKLIYYTYFIKKSKTDFMDAIIRYKDGDNYIYKTYKRNTSYYVF